MPKKEKTITHLDGIDKKALQQLSAKTRTSVSALIRRYVVEGLKREKNNG